MVVGDVTTGTDVLVIGAGPGGYVAAIRAGQLGLDVTLVEADAVGGTCLNYGCIPSKAVLTATKVADEAREATDMGVYADPEIDLPEMVEWKDRVVSRLTGGVEQLCENAGVTLVEGRAEFAGEDEARVVHGGGGQGAETVAFEHAIVATGSRPVEVPGLEFDGEFVLSSRDALELADAPDDLVVVGAGYVGMELSTAFQRMGTDVTVVEMLDGVLPGYEDDVADVVRERAEEAGVDFRFGLSATGWTETERGMTLRAETAEGEVEEFQTEKTLVAVGRRPVTDTLNLEAIGLEPTDDGFLPTDDRCRTPVENVFAIGDVAGEPLLAHKASTEGEIAAEVIAGEPAAMDQYAIPAVVFTDPEIATVGMTESEAEDAGFDVVVGQVPLRANGRALTLDDPDGFVRIVADAGEELLLGAQIVAPEASELIAELGLAIEMGAQLEDVVGTIHPHPTLSEATREACANALGRAIHASNR